MSEEKDACMELDVAYLRPGEIIAHLSKTPTVYIPVAPLEWHGPHLPLGVDPLNARQVALAACQRTGGLLWPTLFWGTERERSIDELRNLGFSSHEYIVGMDFPKNNLPSGYCREEIFALLIRETLRLVESMGAKLAVIVNGHGAVNHNQVLRRLAVEINHGSGLRVHVRVAFPQAIVNTGSIAHAGSDETSLMMHYYPQRVDFRTLPGSSIPIQYVDYAIVDGPGFQGKGRADKVVDDDPRTRASASKGEALFQQTVKELVMEVDTLLEELKPQ